MTRSSYLFIAAVTAASLCSPLASLAAAPSQGSTRSGTVAPAAASSEPTSRIVLKDYPVPWDQAYKLLPTDPGVVTNGPIPDTKANRARYGQPLSRAGRATAPTGD